MWPILHQIIEHHPTLGRLIQGLLLGRGQVLPLTGVGVDTDAVGLAGLLHTLPLELLQVGLPHPAVLLPVLVEQVLHCKGKHHLPGELGHTETDYYVSVIYLYFLLEMLNKLNISN